MSKEFASRGHSLTIDSGWQELAEYILNSLKSKGLWPIQHKRNLNPYQQTSRESCPPQLPSEVEAGFIMLF